MFRYLLCSTLPFALLILLGACSSIPQQRVRTAAAVPRIMDLGIYHGAILDSGFGVSVGAHQGSGVSDSGGIYDATFATGSLYFRQKDWGISWRPYHANIGVSHEDTTHFGAQYLASVRFSLSDRWALVPQLSAAMGSNSHASANEIQCSAAEIIFLLGLPCLLQTERKVGFASAKVEQEEYGIALAVQRSVGRADSWFVAPAIYRSFIERTNFLANAPVGNYVFRLAQWSPALHLGFNRKLSERIFLLMQVGVSSYQLPSTNQKRAKLSGDVTFRF